MTHRKRNRSLALIIWISLVGTFGVLAEEAKPLTVDEAKFQMGQLYLEAKLTGGSLKTKYPALLKADKLASAARQEYSQAVKRAPELKEGFAKIDELEVSIPEKMKLWKPLFAKAETLPSLDSVRTKYNKARIVALKEEIKALRSEGHEDLADGLAAILARVKQ